MHRNNYSKGKTGERLAKNYLIEKCYHIIGVNVKNKMGEIDIIAVSKNDSYYVFLEVKYRKSIANGLPKEAVGKQKQKRIINAAKLYIAENNLYNTDMRFDVIEVIDTNGNIKIEHIENAFEADG